MSRWFESEAEVPAVWQAGDVVLGLYEVLGVAGEGGMGVVYRVRHREWDVELAVKCPKPGYLGSQGERAFVREAQTWIGLELHRHVCACHYVRVLGGIPRLFAEYVEGGSLADWVADRRLYAGGPAVALERMLGLALQFARGLAYAHSRGVVHQDVKPANVLLGADGVARVSDFGIARAAGAPPRGAQASGAALGDGAPVFDPRVSFGGMMTKPYRSPEQARAGAVLAGEQAPRLSAASDVWSLAVSVLELFVGDLPSADGQAAREALDAFLARGSEDLAVPPPPGALVALLERCFRFEPAERPSMAEVAGELAAIYTQQTGSPAPELPSGDARLLAGELSNRALSLLDLGEPEEAERSWGEALAQDPHHVEATYNQGLYQWRTAAITDDELVRRLEAVRASHDQDWHDEYLLALVHLERGDPAAAETLLAAAQAQAGQRPELTRARQHAAKTKPSAHRLRTLEHAGRVTSVALTPDGRLALTGGWDKTARLWELASGRCLRTLEGTASFVKSVALTSDGRVAISRDLDETARLWELVSRRCLRTFEDAPVDSVALTPDGRFALIGRTTARLWELDWDYEFPEPADWDEGARPLLEAFLHARVPYADPLTADGPLRRGAPAGTRRTSSRCCTGSRTPAMAGCGPRASATSSCA